MTICIVALAQYTKENPEQAAIVCVADKAATWDDNIQWESDTSKIVQMNPSGIVVLQSGSEDSTSRMLRKLSALRTAMKAEDVIDESERLYKVCFDELVAINIFNQEQMTRQEYVSAISGGRINPHIEKLAERVSEYDMDCDLLIGGFGPETPFLIHITSPGLATDMTTSGFEAIGSGSDRATPRVLWSDYKKSNPISRTLYDLFDAKANAEMNVGVGYEWDALIAFPGKREIVPEKIKKLIERAWNDYSYSPFERRGKDDLEPAPKNWKYQLEHYVESILPKSFNPLRKQRAKAR